MKKSFGIILVLTFLLSCIDKKTKLQDNNQITGLATPIRLSYEETEVFLQDYFNDISLIDSVTLPEKIEGELTTGKDTLILHPKSDTIPYLSTMKVWVKGVPYSIVIRRSEKIPVTLTFDPKGENVTLVQIAGEVNGWNPKASSFKYVNGKWETTLLLDPGIYQYKLVIDGKWISDPSNPDSASNNMGGYNSLLKVGTPGIKPALFTDYQNGNIRIGTQNNLDSIIVLWQNFEIPFPSIKKSSNGYVITLPAGAKKVKRSYLRAWAWNKNGVSNDIFIPLEWGKPVSTASQLTRNDWRASVFYFLMIDRFFNGDTTNDTPVDDPEVLPKVNYMGGDIAGVIEKMEQGYFDSLGVNTIWLSPVTQNPLGAYGLWPDPHTKFSGYHGYWPVSSSKVDFRFGTDKELSKLITLAHNKNLNVILDYVANHVHKLHPVYIEHPGWATPLYLPDGTLNTEKWDEYRLTTWFDTFLPTLDLRKKEVTEVMTDSALFWVTNFKFDGFRHDATKHIPKLFWRTLTKKIKTGIEIPYNKKIFQIGETYGNRELIGSYISTGMLDGQFDFNVYDATVSVFARDNEPFTKLNEALKESLDYYGYHNMMGYISGNQDKPRFISLAGGDLSFDEDPKLAGWKRNIGVGDPVAYKKLQSLMAFNMTIPGIPTVYYGDEIGMPGANDPDNRRMMRFNNLKPDEKNTFDITRKLIKLRRDNLPLTYGDFKVLKVTDDTYVFIRTYFEKIAVIVFNKSSDSQIIDFQLPQRFNNITLYSNFGAGITSRNGKLSINLQGNSFDILLN